MQKYHELNLEKEKQTKMEKVCIKHKKEVLKMHEIQEEVVALRFRALCYLADECGEDISVYC